MKKIKTILLFVAILLLATQTSMAKVRPASVFTDNMVLQADKNTVIWGTADLAESVTVTINGSCANTRTGLDGKWKVELPAMSYGGPYELNIFADDTLTLQNVMIGEVWLCTGQSNMRMTVSGVVNAKEEIANANYNNIRFLTVPYGGSTEPQSAFDAEWEICSPQTIANKSATGYFFGRKLHKDLEVAIGLIDVSYGGATIFAFMDEATIKTTVDTARIRMGNRASFHKYVAAIKKWEANGSRGYKPTADHDKFLSNLRQWETDGNKGERPATLSPQRFSSLCYNAMVHPLVPFANRGAIWYQGEANADKPEEYVTWFGDYIAMMRTRFNNPEMPYYFVQLAGFENQPNTNIPHERWAKFRLGQEQCLQHPFTGMATAMDIGDKVNIHPKNKQEVGRRLALCALNETYGNKEVICNGPKLKSIETKGGKLLLTFDHCEGGLINKDKEKLVTGFSAVLSNGKVVELKGKIKSDYTIEIKVRDVKRLRYAYANFPVCPLYSGAGLPALSFDKEVK